MEKERCQCSNIPGTQRSNSGRKQGFYGKFKKPQQRSFKQLLHKLDSHFRCNQRMVSTQKGGGDLH